MFRSRPYRALPSLRRWLLKVHDDLLSIHNLIQPWAIYFPDQLTTFEKLVLVLEDRRFFRHGGFDLWALCRETLRFFLTSSNGGASTIDMQFVRTATGYRERTLRRKLYEMLLASLIQFRYSKVTILRSYLNAAYFGWGLRGSDSAAMEHFGHYPDNLSLTDAAKLASMLVFPKPKNPTDQWERKVLRRANYIEAVYIRRKKRFDKIASREVA